MLEVEDTQLTSRKPCFNPSLFMFPLAVGQFLNVFKARAEAMKTAAVAFHHVLCLFQQTINISTERISQGTNSLAQKTTPPSRSLNHVKVCGLRPEKEKHKTQTGVSIDHTTSIHRTFVNIHNLFLHNEELYHNSLFVTCSVVAF